MENLLGVNWAKAYDKVNWEFFLEVLDKRGFGPRWMSWMKMILFNGSVGVSVNNVEGNYFETGKGFRQGDPLSPILFNFVVDILSRMLDKAINHDLIKGLGTTIIPRGVVCLQYADDTIIFLDKDPNKARNLKWILTCFEHMSGMRVNYLKSELVPLNLEDHESLMISETFDALWGLSQLGT